MRLLLLLCIFAVAYISVCQGNDLIVGTSYNTRLIWQQKLDYMAIPFKKRVKEMFYSDPGQQIIKGIVARETDKTNANGIITAGGVGSTFVNIRFKSERGSGLHYQIEIYS
ncbi:uncharacterized protein LOC114355414 [Ostrinia furnacalis]|uniref:uncharacterized protein LOC114355414 n=1 Tax=Ostrinia furnacalis TaxID=93504 RepID=UPI001039F163|nr:uncharacterized protein LOC114355414 [Ostrinia furnacalis]